jgi:hypothetical protein
VNFYDDDKDIIRNALKYALELIAKHYGLMASNIDESLEEPIFDEMQTVTQQINDTMVFINSNKDRTFILINPTDYLYFMDAIRSSLEIYRYHVEETYKLTQVSGYDVLLKNIQRVSNLEGPSKGKKELFLTYYQASLIESDVRMPKVFISYQDNDVKIACQIKDLIVKHSKKIREEDVFVAHRDIQLTEEWRTRMIEQLSISTHLLALCTSDYIHSAFGNQEVGYAIAGKKTKIMPIFWRDTVRGHFGFLESLQTLPNYVDESNLEISVKEILRRLEL